MQFTNALLAATPDETTKVVTAWPINPNNALLVVVGCICARHHYPKKFATSYQKKFFGPRMLIRDSWPPRLQERIFTLERQGAMFIMTQYAIDSFMSISERP
jgi:hypothetical protein